MVVGQSFVWLHFPKTAGHAVERALRIASRGRRDIVFDRRRIDDPMWHDSPAQRRARDPSFSADGKVVVSGIRRLPHWVLSRVYYEAARPPYRVPTREMLREGRFFEQDGKVNSPDAYMRSLGGEVARWVRTEHLKTDFCRQFADILGEKVHVAAGVLGKKVNATAFPYIKALAFHFTPEELEHLYAANPLWRAKELDAYGNLLTT